MVEKLPEVEITNIEEGPVIRATIKGYHGKKVLVDKLYAKFKKPLRKEYGIDICGTFMKNDAPDIDSEIHCQFIRNSAHDKKEEGYSRIADERFLGTSSIWLEDFRALLERAETDLLQGMSDEEILNSYFPKKTKEPKKAKKIANNPYRSES